MSAIDIHWNPRLSAPIAHRHSPAIFTADAGIAGNSAVGISFVRFNRTKLAVRWRIALRRIRGGDAKGDTSLFSVSVTFWQPFCHFFDAFGHFLPIRFVSPLLRQHEILNRKDIAYLGAENIARFYGGAVKIAAATAQNCAIFWECSNDP